MSVLICACLCVESVCKAMWVHMALCFCNCRCLHVQVKVGMFLEIILVNASPALLQYSQQRGLRNFFLILKKPRVYIKNKLPFKKCQFLKGIPMVYDWLFTIWRQKAGSHSDVKYLHYQGHFCLRTGTWLPKNAKPLNCPVSLTSVLWHYEWPTRYPLAIQGPPSQLPHN